MKHRNFRQISYHIRHTYLTLNNIVVVIALIIGASWAWSSVSVMQRNYTLQREIETKQRQQRLIELQTSMLEYQRNYYESSEYQELAAREYFSLADPGEKMLLLPEYSERVAATGSRSTTTETPQVVEPSNFQLWTNFLFGGNRQILSDDE